MRNASKILTLVAAATLVLGGCVNSEQASDEPPGDTISLSVPSPTESEVAPECTAEDIVVEGEPGQKPTVTVPTTCSPPSELLTSDLVPGTGPAIAAGSTAQLNYLLVTWSNGEEADGSWAEGQPPQPITLENIGGQNTAVPGWNEGMIDAQQGARRLIVMPPDLAYGEAGGGDGLIPPNETIVLVVDVLEVTGP